MKFGVVFPLLRRWCDAKAVRDIAQAAESLGYHSIWTGDHLVAPVGPIEKTAVVQSRGEWMRSVPTRPKIVPAAAFFGQDNWFMEPYTLMGYLSGITTTIKIGVMIIVLPYRNPVVQARMVATLDNLCNGRLIFGVGSGHVQCESETLGVPYRERGPMTDEYLRLMIAMWTNDRASFHGKYYNFDDVLTLGRPVQQPYPPLYAGGMSKPVIRRAVKMCKGWLAHGYSPEELARGIAYADEVAKEIGRKEPLDVIPQLGGYEAVFEEDARRVPRVGATYEEPKLVTADEIIKKVRGYMALGVTHATMSFYPGNQEQFIRQMRRFSETVVREFSD